MNARTIALPSLALALLIFSAPAAALPPAQGVAAPAFTLPTLSQTSWSLGQTRGHVVVINFFATWCPPCRAETPDLVATEKRYAAKGVIFVGVDDREDASLVAVFAKTKDIHYPIVLDRDGAIGEAYDVRAIPTTYVLDPSGVIRYRQVDQLSGPLLAGVLDAVIAGTPVPQSLAAQQFQREANSATAAIDTDLQAAKVSNPPNTQALTNAIQTGVAANKKIDDMLQSPDADSIDYFFVNETRDKLDAALANAYTARTGVPNSPTMQADQVETALLLGQIALDQERFADAAQQYAIALKLAPKDTRGYDGAYMAAYEQKDYTSAATLAAEEAQLAPDDPESWLTVASSQNSLKNYAAALEAERKALALASDAYAKKPTDKDAAYELGRVWLKTARTDLLAGNTAAAKPLLEQAQAAAPRTIVAQQASEQYVALAPANIAIERDGATEAAGAAAQPAKIYVLVRNPSQQTRTIKLSASGLPSKWLVSFCYSTVCNPYKVSFALPAGASKRIELLVAPLADTGGPWSMRVSASGDRTAHIHLEAKTAKAAITISAI